MSTERMAPYLRIARGSQARALRLCDELPAGWQLTGDERCARRLPLPPENLPRSPDSQNADHDAEQAADADARRTQKAAGAGACVRARHAAVGCWRGARSSDAPGVPGRPVVSARHSRRSWMPMTTGWLSGGGRSVRRAVGWIRRCSIRSEASRSVTLWLSARAARLSMSAANGRSPIMNGSGCGAACPNVSVGPCAGAVPLFAGRVVSPRDRSRQPWGWLGNLAASTQR